MPNTYLTVTFRDKDAAKALGARWDAVQRLWFVPEGRDLMPFAVWLPATTGTAMLAATREIAPLQADDSELLPVARKGISLSSLLASVSQAVAQACRLGVWTLVELVELRSNGGHVFMGVSERDSSGAVLAKTSAVIWQSTANVILPAFELATGAQLSPGIKLLVRARPVFKPVHGFSLEIDAIDSDYTLGDLEARKREIRERLQAEGVFANNRQLPAPWDYQQVLVIAPEAGAGLGDFQVEADRLQKHGVCSFSYVHSRFQGEGAAREMGDALHAALVAWPATHGTPPDAVVIIRGGGAVNDLAWLNDYDLARLICGSGVPVLTGIGHERDNTVLDEVAHTRFDTPSKVIAAIEQTVVMRSAEARWHFEQLIQRAGFVVQAAKGHAAELDASVRTEARRHLVQGREATSALIHSVRVEGILGIHQAAEVCNGALQQVRMAALDQLSTAKREVPMYWGQITQGALDVARSSAVQVDNWVGGILDHTHRDVSLANRMAEDVLRDTGNSARMHLREGAIQSEALVREITGQGPEKTLQRGFALVRNQAGGLIARASDTHSDIPIEIQFHDGRVQALPSAQI